MQGRASQIDAKSIGQGNHAGQLAREIGQKIDTKLIQNRCQKSLRGTQTRRKIDAATLSGRTVSPNSVPGASRERLGASSARGGRARKAPKNALGRQNERPRAPGCTPRSPKSTQSHVRERWSRVLSRAARSRTIAGTISRRILSMFGLVARPANPPKYCACQQKRRFGASLCKSSCSRDAASKIDENRSQNRPKSTKTRPCRSNLDARSDSGHLARAKSIELGGQGRASQVERAAGRSSQAPSTRASPRPVGLLRQHRY